MAALWKPGRRLFTTAGILMLVTAALHTIGNVSSRPESAEEKTLIASMTNFHIPMGLGMTPSMLDIYYALVFLMSITFTALGVINLLLSANEDTPPRVLRQVLWANIVWVGAYLMLVWHYQVPPPLIFAIIIEAVQLVDLVTSRRLQR